MLDCYDTKNYSTGFFLKDNKENGSINTFFLLEIPIESYDDLK